MRYVHLDPEFEQLARIVADRVGVAVALVEKDYWVTHTLWALQRAGLQVWFKGGTSLSKGFQLIQRFSEDLDLRLDRGSCQALPEVWNWTSSNQGPVAARRAFYQAIPGAIEVPGARLGLDLDSPDPQARGGVYLVRYQGHFLDQLDSVNAPYVKLEVGYAHVLPNVPVDLSSFVHDHLAATGALTEYVDNRPRGLPTVHPLVTVIEKLEAIVRRYPRDPFEPASFVRHYEDVVHVIRGGDRIPPLGEEPRTLAAKMLERGQIRRLPGATDPAFHLEEQDRRTELERSFAAIAPMFWGPRIPLEDACREIREWIQHELE